MSQYVNYVLWEHTEEIKKLLLSQVSQVMRPTSGDNVAPYQNLSWEWALQ